MKTIRLVWSCGVLLGNGLACSRIARILGEAGHWDLVIAITIIGLFASLEIIRWRKAE